MNLLETPAEIWIGLLVAVLVRVKSSLTLGWLGALTTTIVSTGAGLVLYKPMLTLLGLSGDWGIICAILIALTAENLMKMIIDASDDAGTVKRVLRSIIARDPSRLFDDNDRKH